MNSNTITSQAPYEQVEESH